MSCAHLPNTCFYKDKCVCSKGYSGIVDDNGLVITCITDADFESITIRHFGYDLENTRITKLLEELDNPKWEKQSKKSHEV